MRECKEYYRVSGPALSRQEVLESYMVFGGISYYMDLMHRRLGLRQNVDRLCFAFGAPLADEFHELYHSLFNKAARHVAVVHALAAKGVGLTRGSPRTASPTLARAAARSVQRDKATRVPARHQMRYMYPNASRSERPASTAFLTNFC